MHGHSSLFREERLPQEARLRMESGGPASPSIKHHQGVGADGSHDLNVPELSRPFPLPTKARQEGTFR